MLQNVKENIEFLLLTCQCFESTWERHILVAIRNIIINKQLLSPTSSGVRKLVITFSLGAFYNVFNFSPLTKTTNFHKNDPFCYQVVAKSWTNHFTSGPQIKKCP